MKWKSINDSAGGNLEDFLELDGRKYVQRLRERSNMDVVGTRGSTGTLEVAR